MNIKSTFLALALAPFAMAAFATTASPVVTPVFKVTGGTATDMQSFENIVTTGYSSEKSGSASQYDVGATLTLMGKSDVTFTFVGKEASYIDSFYVANKFEFNNQTAIVNVTSYTTSITYKHINSGTVLNFGFKSQNGENIYKNGSNNIALMTNANDTSVLALFNDGYKHDKDFDDMGVKISLGSVSPVPEPESYALLLAGLGLIGTIVRRRKAFITA
jgi:hypothetical protein